ncbi:TPA: hypothetical protein PXN27_003646 [Yersinia enterocolitica]|nr:hypothetical protein [Yersinia enterocolitica]
MRSNLSLSIRSFATSSQSCYTTYGLPVSKMRITSLGLHNLFITLSGRFDFTNARLVCVALLYHRQQSVIQ